MESSIGETAKLVYNFFAFVVFAILLLSASLNISQTFKTKKQQGSYEIKIKKGTEVLIAKLYAVSFWASIVFPSILLANIKTVINVNKVGWIFALLSLIWIIFSSVGAGIWSQKVFGKNKNTIPGNDHFVMKFNSTELYFVRTSFISIFFGFVCFMIDLIISSRKRM